MDDDLPSATPEKSGNDKPAADTADQNRKKQPKKEVKPLQRKSARKRFGLTQSKWRELFAILLLIPWVWNDFSEAHGFFRVCLLAITLAIAQGIVCSFWGFNKKTASVWILSLLPIAVGFWVNSQPEPRPHFTVSFGTEDTETVALTNEYLFQGKLDSVKINADKSRLIFESFAHAAIIIPVDHSKTNVVFMFEVQNDSPVTVYDLSMFVGFSKGWNMGVDSARWKEATGHFIIPGWELTYTNLQSWAADDPSPMFPSDSIQFGMTNFTINLTTQGTAKGGLLTFMVRSTGFEQAMAANILFVPKQQGFIKPIVAKMMQATNGAWHLSLTPKEAEDSQK